MSASRPARLGECPDGLGSAILVAGGSAARAGPPAAEPARPVALPAGPAHPVTPPSSSAAGLGPPPPLLAWSTCSHRRLPQEAPTGGSHRGRLRLSLRFADPGPPPGRNGATVRLPTAKHVGSPSVGQIGQSCGRQNLVGNEHPWPASEVLFGPDHRSDHVGQIRSRQLSG